MCTEGTLNKTNSSELLPVGLLDEMIGLFEDFCLIFLAQYFIFKLA